MIRPALLWLLGVILYSATAGPVADFEVKAPADGKVFRLSEAKDQYVVLHFLLKTECPMCQRHVREYVGKAAQLPGVRHIFLKPDSDDEIRAWVLRAGVGQEAGISIFRDPEARLAQTLGIPFGYEFHGEKVHYPALVLLDRNFNEVFRHVGRNNTDRYRFDQLKIKIRELEQSTSKP